LKSVQKEQEDTTSSENVGKLKKCNPVIDKKSVVQLKPVTEVQGEREDTTSESELIERKR